MGKCRQEMATLLAEIATTTRVEGGLKISVMVGGVNLGGRIGRLWLASARKCIQRGVGDGNLEYVKQSSTATVVVLVLVEGPGQYLATRRSQWWWSGG